MSTNGTLKQLQNDFKISRDTYPGLLDQKIINLVISLTIVRLYGL